jgi:hypothetical protein
MKFTFNSVHAIVGTVVVALVSFSMQGKAYAGITPSISSSLPTTLAGQNTSISGASTWDFSGSVPSGVTLSGGAAIVSGSLQDQYAEPFSGSGNYLTVGGNSPSAPTASLTFATALKSFGLFWGTPDDYNTLNFYNGASLLASFVPGSGALASFAATRSAAGARYVDFSGTGGTVFDRVEFVSSQAAFEVDNISYSKVPTPAMLPAIIGFGLTALKRRKQAAQA